MTEHQHEALDRTFTIQIMIENLLQHHPYITGHLAIMLKMIQEDLCDFYQAVGDHDD
jgi:hypothetical protein